jgi:hypothetical membrane protein
MNQQFQESSRAKGAAIQRIGAIAGILAPQVFPVLIVLESILRPGYNQINNYISDLGVGPFSIIQNTNFIVFGLLITIFGLGFGRILAVQTGRKVRAVVSLLVIGGLGCVLAGVFLIFLNYFGHLIATFISFVAIIVVQFFVSRTLKGASEWRQYRIYSLMSGLVSLALLFLIIYSITAFPYLSDTTIHGLTERLLVAVPLIWIEVSGVSALKKLV